MEGTNAAEDLVSAKILLGSERSFQTGAGLNDGERVQLLLFLIQNMDMFAWKPYEVPGVDPEFIVHKLNVDPLCPPPQETETEKAHTVHVLTEYPLQSLLRRSDFTGRIAKWGTRLGSFDIRYKPRNSVKGQVLADFIAEFSPRGTDITCVVEVKPWKVFVDGASNAAGAGAGIVVITLEDLKLEHSFRLGFKASNNEAEYEALLAGLRVVMDLGAKEVEVYSYSLLVVSQVQGNFEAKDPRMIEYLRLAKQMMGNFMTVKIERIARGQNRHADSLATLASSIINKVPWLIKMELVPEPSIAARALILQVTEVEKCWMDPIIDFLSEDRAPEDEKEAAKVRRTFARYWLSVDQKLYSRSFEGPYLQCLHPSQAKELLAELHEGVCGSHVGGRSLAHRAMTQGFWWPQMRKEATEYAQRCEQCQVHVPMIYQSAGNLNPVCSPWPFARWGMDIVGPFPQATGNRRFGVPESLISENGLQFNSRAFREFCENLGIQNRYSTPAYPQSNGQAEATNKAIVSGLKKRLEGAKGRWAEELPSVLWAYRTTSRRSTGETPFSLTYGAEAVIPAEVNLCSARVTRFAFDENEKLMAKELNLLEERRDVATIRLAEYQQKLARRYKRAVRRREFDAGDLVLRKVVGNTRETSTGKLAPTWEGPYRVTAIAGAGAYYLEDLEEKPLHRPWNVHNLKKNLSMTGHPPKI
ncbi:uncharacterized protein LOC142609038 [Castanea sativa]|uniref:uncharacterized protein LOC142609038 n=1 Tax=Castanea sativa TaxID=21020 RepID=UPI003F64E4C1